MRQILGVWGQSPRKHVLPPQTVFLSRAPSHNACITLIWSDRVNAAESVGLFFRFRCRSPRTERAAAWAGLSDD